MIHILYYTTKPMLMSIACMIFIAKKYFFLTKPEGFYTFFFKIYKFYHNSLRICVII